MPAQAILENDLTEGRYLVGDRPVAIPDIQAPVFLVGTERDHVTPWHWAYKFNLLSDTDVTFVLTSGGHNAGIISELGHPHRHFRTRVKAKDDPYTDPDHWFAATQPADGSWWPELSAWLAGHSGAPTPPPSMGNTAAGYKSLCDAPGTFVMQA